MPQLVAVCAVNISRQFSPTAMAPYRHYQVHQQQVSTSALLIRHVKRVSRRGRGCLIFFLAITQHKYGQKSNDPRRSAWVGPRNAIAIAIAIAKPSGSSVQFKLGNQLLPDVVALSFSLCLGETFIARKWRSVCCWHTVPKQDFKQAAVADAAAAAMASATATVGRVGVGLVWSGLAWSAARCCKTTAKMLHNCVCFPFASLARWESNFSSL